MTESRSLPNLSDTRVMIVDAETLRTAARTRIAELGLTAGDRLLCTTSWDGTVPGART